MKKIRLISFVLVAMMLSWCSCAKEAEHTSSEGSRVVNDDYAKSEYGAAKNIGDVHELMCELIGMNLEEAENRIEEYFCCTLEFESYSYDYGYDDYYFNTEIEI